MSFRFSFNVTPASTDVALVGPDGSVPFARWAAQTPPPLRPGVDLALRLVAAESAVSDDVALLMIEHSAVADLSAREATLLQLPPATDAVAQIATKGVITQPSYELTLRWLRPTGQAIIGAHRIGAWLAIGEDWRRLPDPMFGLVEACDAAREAGEDAGARLTAIAQVLELLPEAKNDSSALATGMLGQIQVHVADAFSLDLVGDGEATRLIPVLHRAGGDPQSQLFPEPLQRAFADRHFHGYGDARSVYTLESGNMVVFSPSLRRALSVVRRVHSAPPAARRAVFANPRLYLREALGDEDETLIENIFQEMLVVKV